MRETSYSADVVRHRGRVVSIIIRDDKGAPLAEYHGDEDVDDFLRRVRSFAQTDPHDASLPRERDMVETALYG